ncbi:unnamed protein product [Lactuca virosa]|uniref:Major facilitator superfamily (MFS) profile domain-containing protein n=1 Tax=Lactuca virosa TaxID=75947 RepID=A0AAU9NQ03_9ASTR|nr:unnamed protein product [Lactuca virosa]
MRRIPAGILVIRSIRGKDWSLKTYRYLTLFVTFVAYTSYHASRKPSSIIKSVLDPPRHDNHSNSNTNVPPWPWPIGDFFIPKTNDTYSDDGWAPFNGKDGTSKLGEIDVAFLAVYSLGMRRGLIMGIWNAHTSVGNISGSLLAASVLDYGWGWCFILPAAFIMAAGVMVFLFLAAYPEDVGFLDPSDSSPNARGSIHDDNTMWEEGTSNDEEAPVPHIHSVNRRGVGFVGACFIPGVIPFALCLFFSKLVAYTFLFWLPFYLSQTEIGGEQRTALTSPRPRNNVEAPLSQSLLRDGRR